MNQYTTGSEHSTKYGKLVVVEYKGSRDVLVKFVDTGYSTTTTKFLIKTDGVKDKLSPSVYGLGVMDCDYQTTYKNGLFAEDGTCIYPPGWTCPVVNLWRGIVQRCSSFKFKEKNPTYIECDLDQRWVRFSGFKAWYDMNFQEGLELDKDVLFEGNKVYGPDTCAFVPQFINSLILVAVKNKSPIMMGVSYLNKTRDMKQELQKPYYAKVSYKDKSKSLGTFGTKEEAHKAWQIGKANVIFEAVRTYSKLPVFNTSVADALLSRAWRLLTEASYGIETKTL